MMSNFFSPLVIGLLLSLSPAFLVAQTEKELPETVDIIYTKTGANLVGEILIFEEADGDITFEDLEGRKYSLTREDYDYFLEDQPYRKKRKERDDFVVRERKTTDLEYSFGLALPVGEFRMVPDPSFELSELFAGYYFPVSVRLGIGKYFNRRNYLGLRLDIQGLGGTEVKSYLSGALKYKFQMDGHKRNVALYLLGELQYFSIKGNFPAIEAVTTMPVSYETFNEHEQKMAGAGFSFGPGLAFILENKKSFSIEAALFRNSVLENSFVQETNATLFSELSYYGWSLGLTYNL